MPMWGKIYSSQKHGKTHEIWYVMEKEGYNTKSNPLKNVIKFSSGCSLGDCTWASNPSLLCVPCWPVCAQTYIMYIIMIICLEQEKHLKVQTAWETLKHITSMQGWTLRIVRQPGTNESNCGTTELPTPLVQQESKIWALLYHVYTKCSCRNMSMSTRQKCGQVSGEFSVRISENYPHLSVTGQG